MKNTTLATTSLKLDKFKKLVSFTASNLVMVIPLITSIYGAFNLEHGMLHFLSYVGALGFGLGNGIILVATLVDREIRETFIGSLFSGQLFKDAWDNLELKTFQSNNEKMIIELRRLSDLNALSNAQLDEVYKKCAHLEFEKIYLDGTYNKWFNQIRDSYSPISWVQKLDLNNYSSGYKWNNLYALSLKMREQPSWDKAKFQEQLDIIIEREYSSRFTGIKNAGIYRYFEQMNDYHNGERDRKTNYIEKTERIIKQEHYKFSERDYKELAKSIAKFDKNSILILSGMREHLTYPKASWVRIKQIVQDNYKNHNEQVEKFFAICDTFIKVEKSESEQSRLLKMAIETVRENETGIKGDKSNDGEESLTSVKTGAKKENKDSKEDNSVLLGRCELVDYEAHYHRDLWAQLKEQYNLIYSSANLLDPMEFKKLNMAMQGIMPLLIKSDKNFKELGAQNQETIDLLAANLNIVLAEVKEVHDKMVQKVHVDALVNNKYLHIRSGK